jgi:fumarate reductase (CoM/CoB) subunit A
LSIGREGRGRMSRSYEVVETDVLVIGGGLAGIMAAVKAQRLGAKTCLVIKGKMPSGATGLNKHLCIKAYVDPRDEQQDAFFNDCIKAGSGMADERLVRIMVDSDRRQELEEWGLTFHDFDPSGLPTCWATYVRGASDPDGIRKLRGQMLESGVEIRDRTMVTTLCTTHGAVTGAVGVDKDGGLILFAAKATILATGGPHQMYQHGYSLPDLTGDGHAMAYNVGAELVNLEFPQICIRTFPRQFSRTVGHEFWRTMHMMHNDKGASFLEKYLPEGKTIQEVYELRAHHCCFSTQTEARYVDIAIFKEVAAGRSVFVHSQLVKSLLGDKVVGLMPYVHAFLGGVRINERAETNVPGLYAVGEAAGGVHGSNRPGGNMHIAGIEFGARAAENAVDRAGQIDTPEVEWDQYATEEKRIAGILERKPRIDVKAVKETVRRAMWSNVLVVRTERGLTTCMRTLEEVQEGIAETLSGTKENLFDVLSLPNLLDVAILTTKAALMRRESRGGHYREDFPSRDDEKWGQPIVLVDEEGAG